MGYLIKSGFSLKTSDFSAISGFSIYEDTRVKFINPRYRTVPFTIVYSYEVHYEGILDYPDWRPVDEFNISDGAFSF